MYSLASSILSPQAVSSIHYHSAHHNIPSSSASSFGTFPGQPSQYIPSQSIAQHAERPKEESSSSGSAPDPFSLVREEIESVTERVRRCIVSDIPVLEKASEYFFRKGREGKRLRSTVLLLLASSLAATPAGPLVLTVDETPASYHHPDARRRQQRVAEITELIHVASLLHDDVIDGADKRRGMHALNMLFGNKIAILAGDFLLARASVTLAALKNSEVIALMSQVLENLVAGEILQMNATREEVTSMDYYLKKTFLKTASLLANSCKSVAVIAGCDADSASAAWEYGQHLGLAFQLVDDILDFTGSSKEMGKPALADLRSGLATAPLLYAAEEHPELLPMIQRRFGNEGDVDVAADLVLNQSKGVQRAKELAQEHADKAIIALQRLPSTTTEDAAINRKALENVLSAVLNRKK